MPREGLNKKENKARANPVEDLLAPFLQYMEERKSGINNPVALIEELEKLNLSRKQYDVMIESLEKETLKLVPLLENYQLRLRGDAVNPLKLEKFKEHGYVWGMVVNRPWILKTQKNIHKALGELMCEIIDRYQIGSNRSSGVPDPSIVPVIYYSSGKRFEDRYGFSDTDLTPTTFFPKDFQDYFIGHGSDVGFHMEKDFRVLVFPKANRYECENSDKRLILPRMQMSKDPLPVRQKELYNHNRVKKFNPLNFRYGIEYNMHLILSNCYFQALACADKILSSIKP